MNQNPVVGRFAPSPSGRMHLGNAFSALLAWLSVRSQGGKMILRLEDLDPDRCKIEYCRQVEEDFRWLGLDWDEGGLEDDPHYRQSNCGEIYAGYLARQEKQVAEFKKEESRRLPEDLDYNSISGLRLEARQKLSEIRPMSIGQAGRISGVSPADIAVLLIWLEQNK